jgi:hypothetical protein
MEAWKEEFTSSLMIDEGSLTQLMHRG